MTDAPFWSDDFDMDLPKVFPQARGMLGDLADIKLVTSGRPDGRTGRLNHPCVWNKDHGGTVAYFGFHAPQRPQIMVAPGAKDIECTAWEAFRDCWSHNYLMILMSEPLWDTGPLWNDFQTIMWAVRKYREPDADELRRIAVARARSLRSYAKAVRKLRRIAWYHGAC